MPSWSDGPTPDLRDHPAGRQAPRRRTAPGPARGPRRRPDRRLVLAAGQGRSCGHRPPRGRERLHRGGHGRHRRPSRPSCSRRWWPASRRPTSRSRCARAPGSTTAARWRAAATPSTAAGRPWTGGGRTPVASRPGRTSADERSSWTRTSWPTGTTTSPSAASPSAPTTAGWPTRPTPPAASASPCASRDLGTGTDVAGVARGHLLRGGLGQRQRHRLLRPGRRGHAALPALAPPGRDRPGHRRPGLRGARRPLLPRGGPDQGRPVRADEPRLEGDLGGPGPAPPTTRSAPSRSSSPAARGSSTASTTTGATGRARAGAGSSS